PLKLLTVGGIWYFDENKTWGGVAASIPAKIQLPLAVDHSEDEVHPLVFSRFNLHLRFDRAVRELFALDDAHSRNDVSLIEKLSSAAGEHLSEFIRRTR